MTVLKSLFNSSIVIATLSLASPALAVSIDLTGDIWDVSGIDDAGNVSDGSKLEFTSQIDDGDNALVEGYFLWSSNTGLFGTEIFSGTFFSDLSLELTGTEIPGQSEGVALGFYTGTVTDEGNMIIDGKWDSVPGGPEVIPGTWSATRDDNVAVIPEPSSILASLVALGFLGGKSASSALKDKDK